MKLSSLKITWPQSGFGDKMILEKLSEKEIAKKYACDPDLGKIIKSEKMVYTITGFKHNQEPIKKKNLSELETKFYACIDSGALR